jgi:hypothetical protein
MLAIILLWLTLIAMLVVETRRRSPALLFAMGCLIGAGPYFTANASEPFAELAINYALAFNLVYLVFRVALRSAPVFPVPSGFMWRQELSRTDRRFLTYIGLLFLGIGFTTALVYRIGSRGVRVCVLVLAVPLLTGLGVLSYEESLFSTSALLVLTVALAALALPAIADARQQTEGPQRSA